MSERYIVEFAGRAAGIVVREEGKRLFAFHAAEERFHRFQGLNFTGPRDAERTLARHLGRRRLPQGGLVALAN